MKQITLKLKKNALIDWYLEGEDSRDTKDDIAKKALSSGCAPIEDQIKTLEDVLNWFGFLPKHIIANWEDLPLSDEAKEVEELEDFDILGDDVIIRFV